MPTTLHTDGDADRRTLDDFWEASSLTRLTARAVAARVMAWEDAAASRAPAVPRLTPAGAPIPLRPVRDRLQRLFARRRSERDVADRPLTHRQLTRLLAATGPGPDGRRVVPEAGGLPCVHVHAVVRRATGPLAGHVVRYDHVAHAATPVGPVPGDDELRRVFQLDGDTLPALVLAFAVDLDAVTAKYGPRGGRFALQQVGHAAQNVGLRLAHDGLRGYVLGGGIDHEVLGLLGLASTTARCATAVACGR